MNLHFESISLSGPKGYNSDSVLLPFEREGQWWCAVADGVGAGIGSSEAAQICCQVIKEIASPSMAMHDLFQSISDRLLSHAQASNTESALIGYSSTLTVLKITADRLGVVGHVGDTRLNHIRGRGIRARTTDQTEVQKLVLEGALTKHQAKRYPRRNILLSALSPVKNFVLEEHDFSLEHGDRLILSSDGFHSHLLRQQILEISLSNKKFSDFWLELEKEIRHIKRDDDLSCVALQLE